MSNTVEFYLNKGFDKKTAEYFANGRRKVLTVIPNKNFTLTIEFDNGEKRVLDMSDFLQKGTVFEPFMNWDNFSRVYVDENHCVAWDVDPTIDSKKVWNNKVDLSPDGCYLDSIPLNESAAHG